MPHVVVVVGGTWNWAASKTIPTAIPRKTTAKPLVVALSREPSLYVLCNQLATQGDYDSLSLSLSEKFIKDCWHLVPAAPLIDTISALRSNFRQRQRKYELRQGRGKKGETLSHGNQVRYSSSGFFSLSQNISKRFNNEFRNKISMKIDIKVPTKDKQLRQGKESRESCLIELAWRRSFAIISISIN